MHGTCSKNRDSKSVLANRKQISGKGKNGISRGRFAWKKRLSEDSTQTCPRIFFQVRAETVYLYTRKRPFDQAKSGNFFWVFKDMESPYT
jgi:hypothetical protein